MSREKRRLNHEARATAAYAAKLQKQRQSNCLVRAAVEHPYLCGLFCVLALTAGAAVVLNSSSSSELAVASFPLAEPLPNLAITARLPVVKAPKVAQEKALQKESQVTVNLGEQFSREELKSVVRFSQNISAKEKTTAENKLLKAFEHLQAHPKTFGFTSAELRHLFKSGLKIEVVKKPPENILTPSQTARIDITSGRADRSAGGTIYIRLKTLTKGVCEGSAETELMLLTSVLQEELMHAKVYQEGGTFCFQGRLPPCSRGGRLVGLTVNLNQVNKSVDTEFTSLRSAIQKDLKNLPQDLTATTPLITTLSAGVSKLSFTSSVSCYENVSASNALNQHVKSIKTEFSQSSNGDCSSASLLGVIEAETKINSLPEAERTRYFPNYSRFSRSVWYENQQACPLIRQQLSMLTEQEFSRKSTLSEGDRGRLAREIEANRLILAGGSALSSRQKEDLIEVTARLEALFEAQEARASSRVRVEL